MKPQLFVIRTPAGIQSLREYLSDKEYISFDVETTGLNQTDEIIGYSLCADETDAFYVVLSEWNTETQSLVKTGLYDISKTLLESLKTKQLIMHNSVFDCMMVEAFFKVRLVEALHTDTMILAHLLDENRRVGLKELGKQYFGDDSAQEQLEMKESVLKNGGKLTKAVYEMYKADSKLMGRYGAQDALLTFKLFFVLVENLYEQGLEKFFYEDESMPLLKGPTYELNTTGLKVDLESLTKLKKQLEAECLEAKEFIYSEIRIHTQEKYPGTNKSNSFNIGSSQQLSWLLFGKLGLEFGTLTDGGKTMCRSLGLKLPYAPLAKRQFIQVCRDAAGSIHVPESIVNGRVVRAKKVKEPWSYIACDKRTLTKIATKLKWVERLLEYQRKMKLLSTYVEGIEERVQYGTIRPSFLQHGTTSGRYSSRSPNFQNLPRDDKRIKAVIVPRPGKVFVGADYSQLEPRVFAYFSNDERLLKAFNGDTDFYSVIGMEVYEKTDCTPQKEGSPEAFGIKYKRLRDLSKVIALASTYGATAHQLAPTTGKGIDETQEDINAYFEKFPGVKGLMLESHNIAKIDGKVVNLFGRPRRMPEAKKITKIYGDLDHADYPYEVRNMLNLAVNHRIQSTGASIVNRAAIRFHKDCKQAGIDCKLVLQVHDSLVIECSAADAENVFLLLQNAMETTTELKTVQLEAVPKVGKSLADV